MRWHVFTTRPGGCIWPVIRTACNYFNSKMPFLEPHELLPPEYSSKNLRRRHGRYAGLLDTALSSVKCAPDPATASHDFAERIYSVAQGICQTGGISPVIPAHMKMPLHVSATDTAGLMPESLQDSSG